jgi:Protein of unknown function (DUF2934)
MVCWLRKHKTKRERGEKMAKTAKANTPEMMAGPEMGHGPQGRTLIAEQAYYKAEQRGFEPGHELDDWIEAEQEFLMNKARNLR